MKMDDYRMTNLVHIDGDERHALIEAFLIARKAITPGDKLQYGSVDVFVFDSIKPPRIEKSEDKNGMTMKATVHDTMLSFEYDFHHGGEIFHGKHNCGMRELIAFEKSYGRVNRCKKEKNTVVQ